MCFPVNGGFTPGFREQKFFLFLSFSGTCISVDQGHNFPGYGKFKLNSNMKGLGWEGMSKFETSLGQEMGRRGGSGNSLPRSALPKFNDKEGWVSYRPPPGCTFSSTDTEGRDCDQAAWRSLIRDERGGKTLFAFSPEGKGIS